MKAVERSVLSLVVASGVFIVMWPSAVLGWGNTGHEAVAFVAWKQMNQTAQKEALTLLALVPQLTTPTGKKVDGFNQWKAALPSGLSKVEQDMFLFMRAATWADSIKHVGFNDSDTPPPNLRVDQPLGFADPASHGYWHFVDHGFTLDHSSVPETPTPNAAVQIAEMRKDLTSDTDKTRKAYELVWLEHLVGDIHQPLHGVTRFVAGKSDLGGNSVKITLPQEIEKKFAATRPQGAPGRPPAELHAFWDDLPGITSDPAKALQPAAHFGQNLPAARASDVANTDPASWAADSFSLANRDGYTNPIGRGNSTSSGAGFQITDTYYNQALLDANSQIALAGARLARILNDIWPDKK